MAHSLRKNVICIEIMIIYDTAFKIGDVDTDGGAE